ncbi:hypothetical protein ATANTOWER_025625 [Ataeniobius toweri]|uniref:Uncharacterized protein n=1 Tax=Ataeniobius toweri TaxID=208326 RepID=A0ABU7C0P8_9TELE|nr:hypothetical protein [Ataeniobius toweri]
MRNHRLCEMIFFSFHVLELQQIKKNQKRRVQIQVDYFCISGFLTLLIFIHSINLSLPFFFPTVIVMSYFYPTLCMLSGNILSFSYSIIHLISCFIMSPCWLSAYSYEYDMNMGFTLSFCVRLAQSQAEGISDVLGGEACSSASSCSPAPVTG